MTEKKPKRPRDVNQLAKMMVDEAAGVSTNKKASGKKKRIPNSAPSKSRKSR